MCVYVVLHTTYKMFHNVTVVSTGTTYLVTGMDNRYAIYLIRLGWQYIIAYKARLAIYNSL